MTIGSFPLATTIGPPQVKRMLSGTQRDRVGWMAEMAPGTESYYLREVPCPAEGPI